MRSPFTWFLVALAVFASACNQSQVDPEADVAISGAVRSQDGGPVAGARVALMKEADAGDVFVGVTSVGLSCLEEGFSECGATRSATSEADGGFAYVLKGRDVRGRFDNASIMELSTVLPRGDDALAGAAVSTRFQVQTEQVSVPLRAWEPALDVVGDGGEVDVRWGEPLPDAFPPEADLGAMRHWVVFTRATEEVWRVGGEAGGTSLDVRILEDTRGGVAAFATIGDIHTTAEAGTDVEVLLRSPKLGYASPAGAPVSRGRPCTIGGGVHSSCVLTDGRFGEDLGTVTCAPREEACEQGEHRQLTIDLGEARQVSLVVVRGCAGVCVVDASTDGASWSQFAHDPQLTRRDLAFAAEPMRARHLRVRSEEGLHAMREISVWDDRPVRAQGSLVVSPERAGEVPAQGDPDGASPIRWTLLVAALAVAIAAVLVVVRRRSGRASTEAGAG